MSNQEAKIVVIDYGMGNLRSVQKGFERVGHQAIVTSDPTKVAQATKVVLPGVGAFEDAMAELNRRELTAPVLEAIDSGKPACVNVITDPTIPHPVSKMAAEMFGAI